MAASLEQPKKAASAFWLWLAEHRESIVKECGTAKGPVVAKAAGEKWKAMSEAEKAPYEAKASAQKAEYEKAMEDFKSQGGVPQKRERRSAKDKEPKKEKDPDRPKKPVGGAYGIFLAEKREEISKSLPADHKMTDIGKAAGERWRGLSDAAKKPYEEQYATKAEEYKKAMEEYKQRGGKEEEEESGEGSPSKAETQKTGRKRPAAGASASPPAKQRRGGKQTETADPAIDPALLQEAEKLGFAAALKNLASRPEVTKTGKDHKAMLNALKSSNGLVNAAKRALLGA